MDVLFIRGCPLSRLCFLFWLNFQKQETKDLHFTAITAQTIQTYYTRHLKGHDTSTIKKEDEQKPVLRVLFILYKYYYG